MPREKITIKKTLYKGHSGIRLPGATSSFHDETHTQYDDDSFDEDIIIDDDDDDSRVDDEDENTVIENGLDKKPQQIVKTKLLEKRKKQRPVSLTALDAAQTYVQEVLGVPSSQNLLSIGSSCSSRASNNPSKYIQDRVNSAKLLQKKEKRNSMSILERQLRELREENRVLNRQIKRQNLDLDRLQGTKGELPTILHAHNEEVRALKYKIKKLQESNKELERKLDKRDTVIFKMKEANRSLVSRNQAKNLLNQDQVRAELDDVKNQLSYRDNENMELRHKLTLKEKSFKQQLSSERHKSLSMAKKLQEAEEKIEMMRTQMKEKEKLIHRSHIYAHKIAKGDRESHKISSSVSLMSLSSIPDKDESFKSGKSTPATTISVKPKERRASSPTKSVSKSPIRIDRKLSSPVKVFSKTPSPTKDEIWKKSPSPAKDEIRKKTPSPKKSPSPKPLSPQKSPKKNDDNEHFFDDLVSSKKVVEVERDDFFDTDHVGKDNSDEKYFDKMVEANLDSKKKVTSPKKSNKEDEKFFDKMVEDNLSSKPPKSPIKSNKSTPKASISSNEEHFFDNLISEEKENNKSESSTNNNRPCSLKNIKRQNSFTKTQRYFESNGTIIEEKTYKTPEKESPKMSSEDKIGLWMPKSNPTPKKNTRSVSLTPTSQKSTSSASSRKMSSPTTKNLSEAKKAGLLAQLDEIDNQSNPGVYEKSLNMSKDGYSPSFGPTPKSRDSIGISNLNKRHNSVSGSNFGATEDPNSSLNSSIASATSRKSVLMKELFGGE